MSAYLGIKTKFTDQECLAESLTAIGVKGVKSVTNAEHLKGYQNDTRPETAEVIIPKKHVGAMANDIGFKKQADGSFQAVISQYDSARYNKAWLQRLTKEYAERRTMKMAKAQGMRLVKREPTNKTVRLIFETSGNK